MRTAGVGGGTEGTAGESNTDLCNAEGPMYASSEVLTASMGVDLSSGVCVGTVKGSDVVSLATTTSSFCDGGMFPSSDEDWIESVKDGSISELTWLGSGTVAAASWTGAESCGN